MSTIIDIVSSLWRTGRKTKSTSGGWISGNAPCCHHRGEKPDKRGRGGLNISENSFVYSCFNCGFKAGHSPGKSISKNTRDFLKWLGLSDDDIKKLAFEALKEKENLSQFKPTLNYELQDKSLPDDCLPITQWIKEGCEDIDLINVIDYILTRNLTLEDYNWHWSAAKGYRDRVIIPFYYEKRIVGWTGRKIIDGKPKYLTSSQNGYVFNIDRQTYDKQFVIVVEGQFDAISIDGVGVMHNDPNEVQCSRINNLGKEVIVVPDRDRAGSKLITAALNNGWNISCPPWENHIKDVSDAVQYYGKIYTLATILHYKETNKIKIEIQRKKLEGLNV